MGAKVLLVDDDPNILSGYTRTLRKRFQLDIALGGAEGLASIARNGPYAVILSDMRMPGMDGIQFLMKAMAQAPDSVRIMLTGNADQQTAIDAVNLGSIFRFLSKPCEPEVLAVALESGIRQYQLITAERELLEQTLKGSMDVLVELLSIADPDAFGRSREVAQLAQKIAQVMELESSWVLPTAAILAQIGALTLPPVMLARLRGGGMVTAREHEALGQVPEISSSLIRHIPRMEEVSSTILFMNKNFNGTGFPYVQVKEDGIPIGARILRVATDYLNQMNGRRDSRRILAELREKTSLYDPRVLDALSLALGLPEEILQEEAKVPHLATHETLQPGQILVEGVTTLEGLLVIPALTRIGPIHLERLRNFAKLVGLKEPFLVTG